MLASALRSITRLQRGLWGGSRGLEKKVEREGEPEKLGSRARWLELHSESGGKPWGTR